MLGGAQVPHNLRHLRLGSAGLDSISIKVLHLDIDVWQAASSQRSPRRLRPSIVTHASRKSSKSVLLGSTSGTVLLMHCGLHGIFRAHHAAQALHQLTRRGPQSRQQEKWFSRLWGCSWTSHMCICVCVHIHICVYTCYCKHVYL